MLFDLSFASYGYQYTSFVLKTANLCAVTSGLVYCEQDVEKYTRQDEIQKQSRSIGKRHQPDITTLLIYLGGN